MISVLSRLRLLNGSKYILVLSCLVLIVSCGTKKQIPSKRPQVVDTDKVIKEKLPEKTKIDTVNWTKVEDQKNPPIINDKSTNKGLPKTDIKNTYKVALFMPFDSKSYMSEGNTDETYIQYYAGLKLAAKNLQNLGTHIDITVMDASNKKKLSPTDRYDIIIAPNDKNTVSELIEFGKEHKTLVISPWYSNSKITEDNPYYLQLRPNLKEHFNKIVEHLSKNFRANEVALVGLDIKNYRSWFKFFQDAGQAYYSTMDNPFMEHFVAEDSLALGEYVFAGQIEQGIRAFVVPNYSFKDEAHVYSVLRKLNAEKGMNKIYVYGMPLLIDSDKVNFDYYNNLNIKIAISDFVDEDSYGAKDFRRQYYNAYNALATKEAFEGHDLIMFLAESLGKYGNYFPPSINGEIKTYLQTSFDVRGVNSNDENYEANDKIDFYENKHLYIIEFVDGKFRKS